MSFYLKDPQSRVDYAIDWTAYLGGEVVAESGWSVVPAEAGGVVVDAAGFDLTRTSARLTGGRPGRVYSVSNLVTLSDGSRERRSICLRVEQR